MPVIGDGPLAITCAKAENSDKQAKLSSLMDAWRSCRKQCTTDSHNRLFRKCFQKILHGLKTPKKATYAISQVFMAYVASQRTVGQVGQPCAHHTSTKLRFQSLSFCPLSLSLSLSCTRLRFFLSFFLSGSKLKKN